MNDQPEVKLSTPFTRMAERIDHNASDGFGGAFVILPPSNAGKVVEGLVLTADGDPANFWMILQSQVTKILEELKQANQPNVYGRR